MALEVQFGQGGTRDQWYLPGTDPTALPQPQPTPPVGDALTDGPYEGPWDEDAGTPGFAALVTAITHDTNSFRHPWPHTLDVVGGWNSVKNVSARSDGPFPERIAFHGFIHVDVVVTSEWPSEGYGPSGSRIDIVGAKRGNIVTGDFDDEISVGMLSNEPTWSNEFRIVSGDGDDSVRLFGARFSPLPGAPVDTTYGSFAGTGGVWNTSGNWTTTFTDLGAGHDRFQGFASADSVSGGAGNDIGRGGDGDDTWQIAGTADGYRITTNGTDTQITDIDPTDGDDGSDDLRGFETIRFGDGTTQALPEDEGLAPVRLAEIAAGRGGYKLATAESLPTEVRVPQVVPVGDVNGDGLADLVVTEAWQQDAGGNVVGLARVVFGAPHGGTAGFTVIGSAASPVGNAVAAGDVNGDGLDDLLFATAGGAKVVFGRAGGGTIELDSVGTPGDTQGFSITGLDPLQTAVVAGVGDFNGYGLADLLLGNPSQEYLNSDPTVAGHVVFGKADGAGIDVSDLGSGARGFTMRDLGSMSFFLPNGLDAAGDMNGDGLADLVLTSYAAGENGLPGGPQAHVVFGSTNAADLSLADLADGTDPRGFRNTAGWPFGGYALIPAALGDVSGDGLGDLLLGSLHFDEPPIYGTVQVVFGKTDGATIELGDLADGRNTQGFIVEAAGTADLAGRSVSGVGDLNGDGLADLLIGVPRAQAVANVVFGKPDGAPLPLFGLSEAPSSQMFNIERETTGWRSAAIVAGAGDVNGDGLPDLLVADPTEGGGTYVIFGRQEWRDGTTTGGNAAAAAQPDWAEALDLRFSKGSVGLGHAPAPPEVSEGVGFSTIALYENYQGDPILANVIEATGAWNSVKNLQTGPDAWSEALGRYLVVSNFVDVRMDFSNTPPGPEDEVGLELVVHGVKRGEVTFGDGNATAYINFHSNEASWNNTFIVHAGTGTTDVVGWLANSSPTPVKDLLEDNADPTNGEFWNPNYDGRYSRLEVFGGDGMTISAVEQRVTLIVHGGRGLDAMYGADGDDVLDGGGGLDFYTGGGGHDQFILRAGEVDGDKIIDFDGVGAAAGDVIRLEGFAPGTRLVQDPNEGNTDAVYTLYAPPYLEGEWAGWFTAPKGLVLGQDIIFV